MIPTGGTALDLASGRGRHARLLASQGHRVVAVDRDLQALTASPRPDRLFPVVADLEGAAWPFAHGKFTGIVVTNYLWRPLLPRLAEALAPDGVLIYETFMAGNERYGRPRNPAFLLQPGELAATFASALEIVATEEGPITRPRTAVVQRLCAKRRVSRRSPE